MFRPIETPPPALDFVESQGPIESLPQVRVLHRHHLPEEFPAPAVGPPVWKPKTDPLPDVVAALDQGHTRRLIERFQGPHDRQQIEAFAGDLGLGIVGFELPRAGLSSAARTASRPLPWAWSTREDNKK